MKDIEEGTVVICGTGQAGTYIGIYGKNQACVLLTNGCMWFGPIHQMRIPQSRADLDAAPLEVERFEGK